ncbi:MAG: HAD family phosphatase [Clostridia bacterium]|nr:HAD family phosphatase [Clostridia bacterium]
MIQAVLFDMDGTVLDTEQLYREGLRVAGEQLGLPSSIMDQHPFLTGTIFEDGKRHMQGLYGEDFPYDQWFRMMREYADRQIAKTGIPVKRGAPQVFGDLHRMGCKTALVTATRRHRVERYLGQLGWEAQFDCIIDGERVERGKPAPDIYLLAASELGISPDHCLVAEDARSGIISAKNAGMIPVFIPDLYPAPAEILPHIRYTLASLAELPGLISKLNQTEK